MSITGEYIGVDNLYTAPVISDLLSSAQVEKATVVGTISTEGNATITVTATGMTGSPKAVTVAVALADDASAVAGKIRTALNADSAITDLFTVGGTGAEVTLTRKTAANHDSTLNIAIANGTCAGLTADATSDTVTYGSGYIVGTPTYLAPAASIASEPSNSTKTRYYDNIAYYVDTTEAETKVTAVVSGIDVQQQAMLLGKHYDAVAKRLYDAGSPNAPYLALGFRTMVPGGYRYFWYLKGKFAPIKEEASTKTADIDEKTTTLEFTAAVTAFAGFDIDGAPSACKRVVADDQYDTTITTANWFDAVEVPALYSA